MVIFIGFYFCMFEVKYGGLFFLSFGLLEKEGVDSVLICICVFRGFFIIMVD